MIKNMNEENKELLEQIRGLSWNLHKNNQRLDSVKHLLEDILNEIKDR